MKRYLITRDDEGVRAAVVIDGESFDLDPRYDLRKHSPTGFEFGYEGSGPAQLALALVADALDNDDRALRCYQGFKRRVVAQFSRDVLEHELTVEQVHDDVLRHSGGDA